ncbi:DNA-binding response regulator [Clostridium perfringens]|uniref:DNA-binding response regulator n=2 Tax=Clostridium perfringens TaxID=1502 RepID=UPI0024BD0847|nr:DNA-binding response regulator [Clostridium perfringens]
MKQYHFDIGECLYTDEEVNEVHKAIELIYPNNDNCYVGMISKKSGLFKSYNVRSLKDKDKLRNILNYLGKEDIYMSLNTFKTMRERTRRNIFSISILPVDVDYKKIKAFKDLEKFQIIQILKDEIFDKRIPTPTYIEVGNNIRLIYSVETCYCPKDRDNLKILCTRICEVFAKELKEYGAEKQNIESYMRIPTSINSRNGAKVELIPCEDTIIYTVRELQELWLDELPKWYKRKKGRVKANNKVVKIHNVYVLNSNRLRDLEKIQEYINLTGKMDYRARLCFLYRNFILVKIKYQNGELKEEDYKYAEEEMLRFNSKFKEPYRPHVIERNTRSVNHTQYLYKNETLLNFLELTWELCEELGLESIYKPKTKEDRNKDYYKKNDKKLIENEKAKYKKSLKEKGKLSKKEEIEILRQKIKALKLKGLRNKEIAIDLNVNLKTLERHITFLKRNGLL